MRFSKYNLVTEVEKGLVLYNSKLGRFVNIFEEENIKKFQELLNTKELCSDNEMVQLLYKNGYIVDDELDEYKEVKERIKDKIEHDSNCFTALLYVTEKCNFRCVYCPQKHKPQCFSEKNWQLLFKHIKKNIENGNYKYIYIQFFGGEPLLEYKSIVEFCTKLNDLIKNHDGVVARHQMTTNGYLLTPERYDKLTECGVCSYQITLDGFAEAHNKTRPLANGNASWDTIVKNLKYINSVKDNTIITLRTNSNETNFLTLETFYQWLHKTFDNPKMMFLPKPVSKLSDNVQDNVLSKNNTQELNRIIKKYSRYFIQPKKDLMFLGETCSCMAKNHYAISVDGKFAKCEQAYDEEYGYVATLTEDGDLLFNEQYTIYTENLETKDCPDCLLYPLCGARRCFKLRVKYPDTRPDCVAIYDDVKEHIRDYIYDGYLHEDHKLPEKLKIK